MTSRSSIIGKATAALFLLMLFSSGCIWMGTVIGMVVRSPDAVMGVGFILMVPLATARWAGEEALPRSAPLGYFGASAGAAAALSAAAQAPALVAAVVSRGGRPDLADRWLPRVTVPTLFIVGENDRDVLHLNEQAAAHMEAPRSLLVIPGASHLFEEPGTLREVARLAVTWFTERFSEATRRASTRIIDGPRRWH